MQMLVVVLIQFIVSFIFYPIKKYRSTKYKKKLMAGSSVNNFKPIRIVTKDEINSVETYLTMTSQKSSGVKKLSLVSKDVMLISGNCLKQNEFSHPEDTFSYKIDNIDVIFPFKMDRYLSDFNEVEIVLTQNYAIAVKLNGHKIDSAFKAIYLAEQKYDKQSSMYWLSSTSKYPEGENLDENIKHTVSPNPKLSKKFGYEILSVRKETLQESACRNKSNKGIVTVFFGIFAISYFNGFWQTKELHDLFWFGVNFLAAIYFYYRKPKSKTKVQFINQIRGKINHKIAKSQKIIVGRNLELSYPKNWQSFIPESSVFNIEMDVDINNKKIVRYGYAMSVGKEVEQFGPPRFWGRNLWLFLIGTFFIYVVYTQAHVSDNISFAYHQFNHDSQRWFFDDASKLLDSNIKPGDLLYLNLNGESWSYDRPVKDDADICKKALIHSLTTGTSFHLAISNGYFHQTDGKDEANLQSSKAVDPKADKKFYADLGLLKISGFVSKVDYDSNHTIAALTINTQSLYQTNISENLLPMCLSLLLFGVLTSTTIFNGFMLLLKLIQNRLRNNKIKNLYANRII